METLKSNTKKEAMLSFEYIDRNRNFKAVNVGMFEKITDTSKVKAGDRFICPSSEEYRSGVVDASSMQPILLFVKHVSEIHLHYSFLENSKSNPAIAWDLCYLLRDDI